MRDYVDILTLVEAVIPSSVGGSTRDDVLRGSLVSYANQTIEEVDKQSRWSLSYSEFVIETSDGVSNYSLTVPTGALGISGMEFDRISRVYYLDENNRIVRLKRLNREDLQRMYTEGSPGSAPIKGKPTHYAIEYTPFGASGYAAGLGGTFTGTGSQSDADKKLFFPYSIFLYPTPDASGPGGPGGATNFALRVGGYYNTPLIVETTGTTTGSSTTLTVPATAYLSRNLVPTNGSLQNATLSVRGAGPTKIAGTNDTLITSWSAMPLATTVTMSVAATNAVSTAQTFFHSTNWMIRFWPKLIQFGMQREIAQYYENDASFNIWDKRFNEQLMKAIDWDADRARGRELMAAGLLGGNSTALSRSDMWTGWGDFGGGW